MTLIELLVVVVIAGMVGTVVMAALVTGLQSSTRAQSRIQALSDLQRGVERVSRELRVADPLCIHTDPLGSDLDMPFREIGATIYRDGDRFVHHFYTSGSGSDQVLLQDVVQYSPATSSTGTLVRSGVFIADIGNALLGEPMFEYFDRSGGDLTTTFNATARVQINLAKQVVDSDPALASTTVEIRNTRYAGTGGDC